MNKSNKNSINIGLKILAILAFALIFVPSNMAAAAGGYNYVFNNPSPSSTSNTITNNPEPVINLITPASGNRGIGTKTITVLGEGFVPGSVGRINGSNRATTFIDSSHLLVQTNSTDMSRNGGFYITVFNGAPGGGYSNATFFTLKGGGATGTNSGSSLSPDTYQDTTQTEGAVNGASDENSNLASAVIFGSNSFLPSGLVQWILFAILILIIVILARKIFGAKDRYDESPMKHA